MKKNVLKVFAVILIALSVMFAEYRIIMRNLEPHVSGNLIAVEVFGQVDYYDFDEWK